MPKIIFVTGGVLSSLGKGTFTSALAKLLKSCGISVSTMKIDPYLNCDAGTLNPYEHGEVFVTRDGYECDLDLGTYERFLDIFACKEQNLMMGDAYRSLVEKERKGEFLGQTIQSIPHLTNEIKSRVRKAAEVTGCDLLIVEIGGTVGDIESEIVLEAAREMSSENGAIFAHLALVPQILTGEQKTKPMQHSVRELLGRGIVPSFIVARCESELNEGAKKKIALFCNVKEEDVYTFPSVSTIYELPIILEKQGIHKSIGKKLGFNTEKSDLSELRQQVEKFKSLSQVRKIGIVGKYVSTIDAYISIYNALLHAGLANGVKIDFKLIDAEHLPDLSQYDGFVVPGGFGTRGTEGKISAIKYARENNIPLLGICFGFQLSVIEYARNVLGLTDANTTEINPQTTNPVIDLLPDQRSIAGLGASMRLGAYPVKVKENTIAHKLYNSTSISKRHRHRYEVSPGFIEKLENAGLIFSGKSDDGQSEERRMEILELPSSKFFMGSQFHPEFDSRLSRPEPLFYGLIKATI
jgi:CTP synthase